MNPENRETGPSFQRTQNRRSPSPRPGTRSGTQTRPSTAAGFQGEIPRQSSRQRRQRKMREFEMMMRLYGSSPYLQPVFPRRERPSTAGGEQVARPRSRSPRNKKANKKRSQRLGETPPPSNEA